MSHTGSHTVSHLGRVLDGEPATSPEHPGVASSFRGLMPRAETSFGAAAAGGWLHVLGGYHGAPHEYDREGQSRSFLRMNLADGSWEELASVGPLQGPALVAHAGALYRVGGMVASNAPGEPQALASLDAFARYDPLSDSWSELPPLPEPRSSHMAAVSGDTLWVCGGWTLAPSAEDGSEKESLWCRTALAFDLADPAGGWRAVSAPWQRRALGVCATPTHVIAIGGMDPDGELTSTVDVLDTASGEWSSGPDFPEPGFGLSAVAIGDDVWASAGGGVLYRWGMGRVGSAAWVPVATWAFPRFFHQLVAVSSTEIVALGGIARGGRIRHVECARLDAGPSRPTVQVWTLPAPGGAKNRQGLFLRDNELFVFGGNRTLEQHDFRPESFASEGFVLDLAALRWSRMQPLPVARQSLQTWLAPDGGSGYALGGFGHDGQAARTQDEVLRYDFDDDTWTTLGTRLDVPRSQGGVLQDGLELWALGGLDYDPARGEEAAFRHVEPLAHWQVGAEEASFVASDERLPGPRRGFGMAELDGRCYLVGGMCGGFELVGRCDVLDLASRAWSTIPEPRATRLSPELVALGGRLYLAGGSSDRGQGLAPDPSLEVFDPASGRWSVLIEELPLQTRHVRMLAFGDRLLLFSSHQERELVQVALVTPAERPLVARDVAQHGSR